MEETEQYLSLLCQQNYGVSIKHNVQWVWNLLSMENPLFVLFLKSTPLTLLLSRYHPYAIWDKHIKKHARRRYFFIFRRLLNNVTCFFHKQHLYKQHTLQLYQTTPLYGLLPSFLQEHLDSPVYNFPKIPTPYE